MEKPKSVAEQIAALQRRMREESEERAKKMDETPMPARRDVRKTGAEMRQMGVNIPKQQDMDPDINASADMEQEEEPVK